MMETSEAEATSRSGGDPYSEIGEWYDAEHDPVVDDVRLFLQLAEMVGDPILELGCGSGRILQALAGAGHRVTGVDVSAAMLERADRRFRATPRAGEVELIKSPLERLPRSLDGRHGVVILSHNTLLHLDSPGAQREALASARRALDPRGMLVVDVVNPLTGFGEAHAGTVTREGRWELGQGRSVTKLSSATVDRAAQTVETAIWYDERGAGGAVQQVETELRLRYVTAAELLLQLELAGFGEVQVYGDYDLEPYHEGSPRIIVTAEATRD